MAEKNSLWKNIRKKAEQNRRTGATPKKPTAEMLRQERKIKAKQYPDGGKVKPIYTNNRNDPRLLDYNDSLKTYLAGQENLKKLLNAGFEIDGESMDQAAWDKYLTDNRKDYRGDLSYTEGNYHYNNPVQYLVPDKSTVAGYDVRYLKLAGAPSDINYKERNIRDYFNYPIKRIPLSIKADYSYITGEYNKSRNTKTINGKLNYDSGWKVDKDTRKKVTEDRSTKVLLPMYKKPVQPVIYQDRPKLPELEYLQPKTSSSSNNEEPSLTIKEQYVNPSMPYPGEVRKIQPYGFSDYGSYEEYNEGDGTGWHRVKANGGYMYPDGGPIKRRKKKRFNSKPAMIGNVFNNIPEKEFETDMYGRPIKSEIVYNPSVNRSYYDSRLDQIILGSDYQNEKDQEYKDKMIAHENYHASQFKNDRSTYLPTKTVFKKPSMASTDEVYYSYHNRKPIESGIDITRFKEENPGFNPVPDNIIFDKILDPEQYLNPFSMEGEAKFYEDLGEDISPENPLQPRYATGGTIIDPRGQWAHPGKRTIVPSPTGQITMQGVPYPVYGKDETGYGQIMYPNNEYQFPGKMIDETPIKMQGGGPTPARPTMYDFGKRAWALGAKRGFFDIPGVGIDNGKLDPTKRWALDNWDKLSLNEKNDLIKYSQKDFGTKFENAVSALAPLAITAGTAYLSKKGYDWLRDPKNKPVINRFKREIHPSRLIKNVGDLFNKESEFTFAKGGSVNNSEDDVFKSSSNIGKEFSKPVTDFYTNWFNDDKTILRLDENFPALPSVKDKIKYDPNDLSQILSERNIYNIEHKIPGFEKSIANTKFLYNPDPKINQELIDNYITNLNPKYKEEVLKRMKENPQGFTDPEGNIIVLNPDVNATHKYSPLSIMAHEGAHKFSFNTKDGEKSLDKLMMAKFPTPKNNNVINEFDREELYPFLMQLRFDQQFKPGEIITPERLQEIKKSGYNNHLFRYYDDAELSKILNTLASNKQQSPYEQYAAQGGYLYSKGGETDPVKLSERSWYNSNTGEIKTALTSPDNKTWQEVEFDINGNPTLGMIRHQLPEVEISADSPDYDSQGFRKKIEGDALEYVPIESALLPANLPFQATSRLGKVALGAAEMLNPVSGFKGSSIKNIGDYKKGLKKIMPEKEYLTGKYSQHAGKELKKAALAFSPSTTKAIGRLDDNIAKSMLSDYRYGEYSSVKDFRKAVKKATLESERLKKIHPTVDFGKLDETNNWGLKKPETLKQYADIQLMVDKSKDSQKSFMNYLGKEYNKKMDLINQNEVFKNIANESPQYTDIIYDHLKNPKVSDDEFVNNLVKQSNTFTRAVSKPPTTVEEFLTLKGRSLGEGKKNTTDVEGFPVSGDYGSFRYKIEPNAERMAEIAATPIEQRWAQRFPENFTSKNENVNFKKGWLNQQSEAYKNWWLKRLDRNRTVDNVPMIKYPSEMPVPHEYIYYPQHRIFTSELEDQPLKGFDVSKINIENPYKYIPGFTRGFAQGGRLYAEGGDGDDDNLPLASREVKRGLINLGEGLNYAFENIVSPFVPTGELARQYYFYNYSPVEYPNPINAIKPLVKTGMNLITKRPMETRKIGLDKEGDYNVAEESWRKALDLPIKGKYIIESKYKPTISTEDSKYYTLHPDIIDKQKIIDYVKSEEFTKKSKPGKAPNTRVANLESFTPFTKEDFMEEDEFMDIDPLQKFQIYKGYDPEKKQWYAAIYDKYDFDFEPANKVIKPYEFYDRAYYLSDEKPAKKQPVNFKIPYKSPKELSRMKEVSRDATNVNLRNLPINKKAQGGHINPYMYYAGGPYNSSGYDSSGYNPITKTYETSKMPSVSEGQFFPSKQTTSNKSMSMDPMTIMALAQTADQINKATNNVMKKQASKFLDLDEEEQKIAFSADETVGNIPIVGTALANVGNMWNAVMGKTKTELKDFQNDKIAAGQNEQYVKGINTNNFITPTSPNLNFAAATGGDINNLVTLQNPYSMKNRYKNYKQGGSFNQFGINKIPDSAGYHHENAYGGVLVGQNAMAEGGEFVIDGNYVVSDEVDGMNTQTDELGNTMAERLEKRLNKYTLSGLSNNSFVKKQLRRPNDSYSAETIEQLKQNSIMETEVARAKAQAEEQQKQMMIDGALQYAAAGGKLNDDITKIVKEEYAAAYGGYINPKKYKGLNMPYSSGGKLPKEVLRARVEAHMSPEAANAYVENYAKGGSIHIKESKKGTFTAAAKKRGKSVQEFARQVLANKGNYSAAMVKKANFARNAAKWKHAKGGPMVSNVPQPFEVAAQNRGGMLMDYANGGYVYQPMVQPMLAEGGNMYYQGGGWTYGDYAPKSVLGPVDINYNPDLYGDLPGTLPSTPYTYSSPDDIIENNFVEGPPLKFTQDDANKYKVNEKEHNIKIIPNPPKPDEPWYEEPWYSKAARYGQGLPSAAASIYAFTNLAKRKLPYRKLGAQTVNYEPERIIDREESRRRYSTFADRMKNIASNAGILASNLRETLLGSNKDLAGRIAESVMREQNTNAQLRQQTEMAQFGADRETDALNEQMYQNAMTYGFKGAQGAADKLANAATEERQRYLQEWIARNRMNTRSYKLGETGEELYIKPDGTIVDKNGNIIGNTTT
jgi:hypothetical protein